MVEPASVDVRVGCSRHRVACRIAKGEEEPLLMVDHCEGCVGFKAKTHYLCFLHPVCTSSVPLDSVTVLELTGRKKLLRKTQRGLQRVGCVFRRVFAILPVLSKVYEKLVLSQLLEYVELAQLFQDTSSGYRKGHSTTTVLLRIRDDIIRTLNN